MISNHPGSGGRHWNGTLSTKIQLATAQRRPNDQCMVTTEFKPTLCFPLSNVVIKDQRLTHNWTRGIKSIILNIWEGERACKWLSGWAPQTLPGFAYIYKWWAITTWLRQAYACLKIHNGPWPLLPFCMCQTYKASIQVRAGFHRWHIYTSAPLASL